MKKNIGMYAKRYGMSEYEALCSMIESVEEHRAGLLEYRAELESRCCQNEDS